MSVASLRAAISANDWAEAQRLASEVGPPGAEAAREFLAHEEPELRLLVVRVLERTGGEEAWEPLLELLSDSDPQVRITACHALHGNPPAGVALQRLALAWRDSPEPAVRRELALILGRRKGDHAATLATRLSDLDRERDALVASLGKLGHPQARARFGRLMERARGARIKELSELFGVIDQPWLLPYLSYWLEREEVVDIVGTHTQTFRRRGVDLACDEVIRQGGERVSADFHLEPYSAVEIASVDHYLRTLPPEVGHAMRDEE